MTPPLQGPADPPLGAVIVDRESIRRRVGELAVELERAYAACERPLVLVCVLKGSLLFTADLARALTIPVEIEFVSCRSYGDGTTSSGAVQLIKDVSMSLRDRDVLMVEDIIDTGMTTSFLRDHLATHHPRSLRLVALLDKLAHRQRPVEVNFRGFEIPDRFVVGYGLDLAERHRNLPDVHVIDGL
ncbi:MAG: hypoxanthine phosphoribosyltransferase [Candidatus Dormiibacterota bacterium]